MQKNFIALIAITMFVLVLPIVMAATTMSSPVANGNYTTGTNNVTISLTVDGNGNNNMTNVSCYYNAAGGTVVLNSTYKLVEILNTTASQTSFTGTGTLATASATYNITCFIYNGTTLNKTISVTDVRADGTSPSVSLSSESSDVNTYGLQKLTWSATDTYLKSTTVTLTSPDSVLCPTQTWTDATATNYIISDQYLACSGTYTAVLSSIDYSGNSASSSVTFTVNAPGAMAGSSVGAGSGVPASAGVISGPGQSRGLSGDTIFWIAIAIAVIYFLLIKK